MRLIMVVPVALGVAISGCATPIATVVQEVNASAVTGCTDLGQVAGSNAIFIGLSASIGRQHAKNDALNQAAHKGATHVVWSQMGTSLTNEWVGQAYRCG